MDSCGSVGATGSGCGYIHGDMLCVSNSFKARYGWFCLTCIQK